MSCLISLCLLNPLSFVVKCSWCKIFSPSRTDTNRMSITIALLANMLISSWKWTPSLSIFRLKINKWEDIFVFFDYVQIMQRTAREQLGQFVFFFSLKRTAIIMMMIIPAGKTLTHHFFSHNVKEMNTFFSYFCPCLMSEIQVHTYVFCQINEPNKTLVKRDCLTFDIAHLFSWMRNRDYAFCIGSSTTFIIRLKTLSWLAKLTLMHLSAPIEILKSANVNLMSPTIIFSI